MSRELKIGLALLVIVLIVAWLSSLLGQYPGARGTPSAAEVALARHLRSWAIPRSARAGKNPFVSSPELLEESRRHFADHCASCHDNNGSGATEMGRNFFPRVPDMRSDSTQRLSDGELYYIIHNGVRWTGMPAWGDPDNDSDSWKLVLFIRHLPQLSQEELQDMQRFNPKSIAEQEEENEEDDFLNGRDSSPKPGVPAKRDNRAPHPEKQK